MKKILIASFFGVVTFAACKKKEDTVSRLISVSYPTVHITSQKYFSFPVGGGPMPNANTIIATAYDSFYHESIKPVIDASKLSSIVPGLYIATVSAKNSYGFIGYDYVYVAITNMNDTTDISGPYVNPVYNDTVHVTKLAAGLYRTDNVAGLPNAAFNSKLIVPGYFVQDADGITMYMPTQPSTAGSFAGSQTAIAMVPADTTFQYVITGNSNFNGGLLTFKKQ